MVKSKKLVLLSHCILNFYSKVGGINKSNNILEDVTKYLVDKNYGIIQLPCPELTLYGLKRWGHVKEQFDNPYFRKHCRDIFAPILDQTKDYIQNGYKISAVIGINGSPSCGVDFTCSSTICGETFTSGDDINKKIDDIHSIDEPGIFMDELKNILKEENLKIKFIAIDEQNAKLSMDLIKQKLK